MNWLPRTPIESLAMLLACSAAVVWLLLFFSR